MQKCQFLFLLWVLIPVKTDLWTETKTERKLHLDTAQVLRDRLGTCILSELHKLNDPAHVDSVVRAYKKRQDPTGPEALARLAEQAFEAGLRQHRTFIKKALRQDTGGGGGAGGSGGGGANPNPGDTESKAKILRLMQQAIYETQEQTVQLDGVVKINTKDAAFHIMTAMHLLDVLNEEIHGILTRLTNVERYQFQKNGHVDQWLYLTYFAYALKKSIDVTFIVEAIMQKFKDFVRNRKKARMKEFLEQQAMNGSLDGEGQDDYNNQGPHDGPNDGPNNNGPQDGGPNNPPNSPPPG